MADKERSYPSVSMDHVLARAKGFELYGWTCVSVTPSSVTLAKSSAITGCFAMPDTVRFFVVKLGFDPKTGFTVL